MRQVGRSPLRLQPSVARHSPIRDWREAIYRLGDFPHQFDLQQSALERTALDLDIIGQVEHPPERTRRDALIEVLMITLFSLRSLGVGGLLPLHLPWMLA